MNGPMEQWAKDAVARLYLPDQPAVKEELLAHMEDKLDAYIQAGLSPEEAEQKVLAEMGDARETGQLLVKVHKPCLGWILWATKGLLLLAFLLALHSFMDWEYSPTLGDPRLPYYYTEEEHALGYGRSYTRLFAAEPGCSASSDGYRFTLTNAALWQEAYRTTSQGETVTETRDDFFLRVEVFDPYLWENARDLPAIHRFYAVDSLGNYYYADYERDYERDVPRVSTGTGTGSRDGLFTYIWDMYLRNYISQDAEWLELRYDRDGRYMALRIDLTGGDAA